MIVRFGRYLAQHHLALVAIVLAVAGTSYAAFDPIGGDGDLDACFARKGGELSLMTKKRCGKGEKRVSWSQTGPQGAIGPQGPAGRSALEPLRSGETVRGVVGEQLQAASGGDEFYLDETMPVPAAAPLTDSDVIVHGTYEDPSNICQGTHSAPTAPPGRVCIYGSQGATVGTNTAEEEGTGAGGINGPASPYGFSVRFYSDLSGETTLHATWAYTAP